MHFSEYSATDFQLSTVNALGISEPVSLGSVTGGNYAKVGEFEDYVWHGSVGAYNGFVKLPYVDPNRRVRSWLSDLPRDNKLLTDSAANGTLHVFVKRLKLKTQKDSYNFYDYRACLINLRLTLSDKSGKKIEVAVVEGMAKLQGADIVILSEDASGANAAFTPDQPPVCKLALVNALRKKPDAQMAAFLSRIKNEVIRPNIPLQRTGRESPRFSHTTVAVGR